MKSKIKIYLSARISADAHKWNNAVCDSLDSRIEVFKPQEHNPYNLDHRDFHKDVYDTDLKAMQDSDIGLLLAPYGRDCAWEVGWYSNSNKSIVAYVENETDWLRDWMIKGGIDRVVTCQDWLYKILKKDTIVSDKSQLIESRQKLNDVLVEIYNQSRSGYDG
jgi:nucleoside 2-deoxyribosyltransferase